MHRWWQAADRGEKFQGHSPYREHVAYGWSAEELALNHPQLTLGEIYSALAYYADHRETIDREVAASEAEGERMHSEPRHRRVAGLVKRPGQS